MKKATPVAVLLAIFLSFTSIASAYIETFDSGSSNWGTYLTDGSSYSWQAPVYSSSGGDPGGYISGSVGTDANHRLYSFDVHATPFGNLTGQTLTVDIKAGGTLTAASGQAMARIYIGTDSGNYFISTNAYSLNLNSMGGGWTTYSVPVTAADFMAWPDQTGTMSFADVAANAVWVGIVFTSSDFSASNSGTGLLGLMGTNTATISIDNFGTPVPTPLPPALLLFAPGLAGVAAIRRKWKQ